MASRKTSMASTYITEKRISQWEDLMRKFSEAHKEQCKTVSLDIPRAQRSTKFFPTGSKYEGSWDVLGMSGYGQYTFPNGVQYDGDFEDGMFHGKGELSFGNGAVLRGKWKKGVMTERTLLFSDSLEYNEEFWKYCKMPDRRFAIEYDIDIMPAGKSFLTADQPTKVIPPGFYDCGDGFYDPKTKVVYMYDDLTSILRSPSVREQKWIIDNCRTSPEAPLGPRPDLYEKWSKPVPNPPPTPAPAAGVRSNVASFRQQSLFEQDFEFFEPNETSTFYDSTRRHSSSGGGRCSERPLIHFKFDSTDFIDVPDSETPTAEDPGRVSYLSSEGGRYSDMNLNSDDTTVNSTLEFAHKGFSSCESDDLSTPTEKLPKKVLHFGETGKHQK